MDFNHNQGPIIVDIHPDDKMRYAPWNLRDFLKGVQGLRPDEIGIYAIILNLLYDTMGQLRDDDRYIAGHCKCEIRYYRKLRQSLIDSGKVFEADGYLYNNRAMAEIAKFCETAKRKREAALLREQQKRDARSVSTSQVRDRYATGASQVRDRYGMGARDVAQNDLSGKQEVKKVNENNDSDTTALVTALPLRRVEIEIETEIEKKGAESPRESLELPLSETRVSDVGDKPDNQRVKHAYSEAFEAFWRDYPETRGMSKIEAWKAWQKLTADQRQQAHAALPAFRQHLDDRRRKSADATPLHAQGYLNQRRFETLVGSAQDQPGGGEAPWWADPEKVRAVTADQWRTTIERHANGRWPVPRLGPPPGSTRCVVPSDIVRELRLTEKYTDGGILK